jgi:hypothetical protein
MAEAGDGTDKAAPGTEEAEDETAEEARREDAGKNLAAESGNMAAFDHLINRHECS